MEKVWRKMSLLWSGDLSDEAYIQYQFDNLRLVGIYPGFSKALFWQRLGLHAIELFCVLQGIAMAWDLLDSLEDIERFGDDTCMLSALIVVVAKRWFCRFYIDDLFEFVEEYRIGFELYRHREQQIVQQLLSYHRLETSIVKMAHTIGSALGVAMTLYGLLSDRFILRAKYPFDTDTFIGNGIVFFCQILLVWHCILSILVVEVFCSQIISQLSLHFHLLSMDFAKIGKELPVDGASGQDEAIVERRQLILRHQYLLELGTQVQEVLEPYIMGLFVITVIMICMCAFEVLLAKGNVILIIRFGVLGLGMVYLIYVWCFLGDLVAQKSSSTCDAISSCNWTVLDKRQKKDLSFIMMRAQNPFVINVYQMFPLTYETFLAILSRAYSAFTVMMEMIE